MKKILLISTMILLSLGNNKNEASYCDIKGSVNNPGVYEIKENYTIQNVIDLAGGLKKEAYTNNINLSKKVEDEMVIYIFNKAEIDEANKLNKCECKPTYKYIECVEKTTSPTTTKTISITSKITTHQPETTKPLTTSQVTTIPSLKKININTCTLQELIILKGLGEIKAQKIIDYRQTNGLFEKLEDLLNVDGIGKTTFEKIKEYIEI